VTSLARLLASAGGLGRAPVASGTFGTLAGIPIAIALDRLVGEYALLYAATVVLLSLLAIWAADVAARDAGIKDPSFVVIDEVAGYVVTVALLPATVPVLAAGFFIFRAFDIVKPPPVAALERLPGGLGIVADDLAAGLLSHVLLRLVMAFGWL
jgi:phosphatidylglycerophosphatase A